MGAGTRISGRGTFPSGHAVLFGGEGGRSSMRSFACIMTKATYHRSSPDFEGGVNVALGLPIVRTSVDHGTAFDIAGRGVASTHSLIRAMEYADKLAAGASTAPST